MESVKIPLSLLRQMRDGLDPLARLTYPAAVPDATEILTTDAYGLPLPGRIPVGAIRTAGWLQDELTRYLPTLEDSTRSALAALAGMPCGPEDTSDDAPIYDSGTGHRITAGQVRDARRALAALEPRPLR